MTGGGEFILEGVQSLRGRGVKNRGINVLTFELVRGKDRYYVVECYIPSSDLTSLENVRHVWNQCPKGCVPMFIGDLNISLDAPRDGREETITE